MTQLQLQKQQSIIDNLDRLSIKNDKWIYTNYNLKRKFNERIVELHFETTSRYKRDKVSI
jgi:hypothetical protein